MRHPLLLFFTALLLPALAITAAGQKFQPKSIQFKGATDYSDTELLSAAHLKPGAVLTSAEMNDHAKLLMDSGVFDNLTFKFDGADLIFTLTPAAQMYPVRLENLPLTPGPELDAKLHDRFPLYHGKVPAEGTLLEQIRGALEDMLAANGITATVTNLPFDAAGTRKVSAMNFAINYPPVLVGALHVEGVSPAMADKVRRAVDQATGSPFDTGNSAANLEHAFSSLYSDEGYAGVHVHAERSGDPVITASAVDIPYSVTIQEGRIYKLGAIHVPSDSLYSQAEIDKITSSQSSAKGVTVRAIWGLIAQRYKSKGYVDFALTPHPELDDAAGIVNYTVDIQPGPVYHLGLLKFDNVSEDLRKLLMRNWQMFPGDPFDESYVSNFIAKAQSSDPILMRTLAGVKVTYDVRADPTSHDVNLVIRLERR